MDGGSAVWFVVGMLMENGFDSIRSRLKLLRDNDDGAEEEEEEEMTR